MTLKNLVFYILIATAFAGCGENTSSKSPFYGNKRGVNPDAQTQVNSDGSKSINLMSGGLTTKAAFGSLNNNRVPISIVGQLNVEGWSYSYNFNFDAAKDITFQSDKKNYDNNGFKLYKYADSNFIILDGKCMGQPSNPCSAYIIKYSTIVTNSSQTGSTMRVYVQYKIEGKNDDLIVLEDNYDLSIDELYNVVLGP